MKKRTNKFLRKLPMVAVCCFVFASLGGFVAGVALRGSASGAKSADTTRTQIALVRRVDALLLELRDFDEAEASRALRVRDLVQYFAQPEAPVVQRERVVAATARLRAYAQHLRFVGYVRERDGTDVYLFADTAQRSVVKLGMRDGRGITRGLYNTTGVDVRNRKLFFIYESKEYEVAYE